MVLILLVHALVRVKLACDATFYSMTRRKLKVADRNIKFCFSILIQLVVVLIFVSFFEPGHRDAEASAGDADCKKHRIYEIQLLILFLTGILALSQLITTIISVKHNCQVWRRRRRQAQILSSDEEDDQMYLRELTERRQRAE